jgi:hypothetical protein
MNSAKAKNEILVVGAVFLVICAGAAALWGLRLMTPPAAPTIDASSGNYGLFIDNLDSGYFSTTDPNVKNIVLAYLAKPEAKTDSDKYGGSLVFYYTKNAFIREELVSSTDRDSVSAFTMYDMKTGKPISDCSIYAHAGLYKDSDLLLSASFSDGASPKNGVCFYQRGAPNFTFIDLTSRLASTETLFNDPSGRNLNASIRDVDTQGKTFTIAVYDTTRKDADGNYAYTRGIEVAY